MSVEEAYKKMAEENGEDATDYNFDSECNCSSRESRQDRFGSDMRGRVGLALWEEYREEYLPKRRNQWVVVPASWLP